VLFFRDIPHIGWNLANGGSESGEEMFKLDDLLRREFAEELILLPGPPMPDIPISQVLLFDRWRNEGVDRGRSLKVRGFGSSQREARRRDDGLDIHVSRHMPLTRDTKWTDTAFSVQVTDGRREEVTRDVVISVNPMELGIEVIKIFNFDLNEREVLLDGELHPRGYLVRRPVVLLSLDFLEAAIKSPRLEDPEHKDRLLLPPIPSSEYVLHGTDLPLRRQRLDRIAQELERTRHKSTRNRLERESKHIAKWRMTYEERFERMASGAPIDDELLRMLTPVAWKTLELGVFRMHRHTFA
jgi:8-oxo-dGTP pyrophosphatase MutT (NUDIX family)